MPKTSCYLAGSIQDSKDGGVKWRDGLTPKLEKLNIEVYDPTKTEVNLEISSKGSTIEESQERLNGWIASGNIDKFQEHMRKVREDDLRLVHKSDFLVVYLDFNRKIGGTIVEIHEAFLQKIPIYVVCYDAKKTMNHWILSTILDGGMFFENWTQLMKFLEDKYGEPKTQNKSLITRAVDALQEIGKQLSCSK